MSAMIEAKATLVPVPAVRPSLAARWRGGARHAIASRVNPTSPDAEPAVLCHGLRKIYEAGRGSGAKRAGTVLAVEGLDLSIRRGECFGLLGPNGSGKTTTVEMLEGLLPPTGGEVRLLGMDWAHDESRLRERMGVALQETRLPEKLTVEEVLTLFRSFYQRPRPLEALLADVQLEEKRRAWVVKLSGGQRQRLAIACALVAEPEILFLDEPTTGLDPQSRRQIWGLVAAYRARGGTVVLTTHYMEEAERLCDRVAILDRGRLVRLGTPAELIAGLGAEHVVELELEAGHGRARRGHPAQLAHRDRGAPVGRGCVGLGRGRARARGAGPAYAAARARAAPAAPGNPQGNPGRCVRVPDGKGFAR